MFSDSYCWHQVQKSLLRCLLTFHFFSVTVNFVRKAFRQAFPVPAPFLTTSFFPVASRGQHTCFERKEPDCSPNSQAPSRQPLVSGSHPESLCSKELLRDKQEVNLSSPSLAPLFQSDMYALQMSFGLSASTTFPSEAWSSG